MADPEIPSPTETPTTPDAPFEAPAGVPQEMPTPPPGPDETGDGRLRD